MRILLIIFVLVAFSNCVTEKQRLKICQGCPVKIETKDSIVERIVEVPADPVPGPTVYIKNPCQDLCDSLGRIKDFEIKKEEHGITTTIKGNSKTNELEVTSNADSLKLKAKVRDHFREVKKEVPVCHLDHVSSWDKFCRWFTIIGLALVSGAVLWRFRKFFL